MLIWSFTMVKITGWRRGRVTCFYLPRPPRNIGSALNPSKKWWSEVVLWLRLLFLMGDIAAPDNIAPRQARWRKFASMCRRAA